MCKLGSNEVEQFKEKYICVFDEFDSALESQN